MIRRLIFPCLVLCVGCNRGALPGPAAADGSVTIDLALSPTGPSCVGLAECDCYHAAGCQVVAEACWCPFPQCDSSGACACGGGKYLGCVEAARHCPQVSCGLVGTASPDGAGCLQCDPPPDCATARTRLATTCQYSESYLAGLSCTGNPPCIAKCLDRLTRCDEVTCDYCGTCDCAGQQNWFTDCYAACLGG